MGWIQSKLEPLREQLNAAVNESWQEWEIPRGKQLGLQRRKRSIVNGGSSALLVRRRSTPLLLPRSYEYLYDKPYEDKKKVRVAGPFTVESLSPHRVFVLR